MHEDLTDGGPAERAPEAPADHPPAVGPAPGPERRRRLTPGKAALIVILMLLLTAGVAAWPVGRYLFRKSFDPVQLRPREDETLERKLRAIGYQPADREGDQPLEPEPYREDDALRVVSFSERELNALLAKNTDLARRLAIDLSDDLVSAKLIVPLDEDLPVLGGKTLRVSAGVELAFRERRPVVILKGVSLMGVPLPNAWLGNLKNIDLVREFGDEAGFWKTFADGVDAIDVEDGRLVVKLKE
ncbi:MAG TPA: arginine N-succinyltransferase [Candidatus Sumerlaeota bacterium]|nr:arginine N-succinyltransferase [Candidatus Sumerlaeota bacterium]